MKGLSTLLFSVLWLLASCSSGSGDEDNTGNDSTGDNGNTSQTDTINIGERPPMLAALLEDGPLKEQLAQCDLNGIEKSSLSIGHRGAPLQFPEHTRSGYIAAAEQGAGILECDVTFTRDRELVCRHSQCDLHSTTNILSTPLAAKCSIPPDAGSTAPYANVQCCTSDITLAEFRTLKGKRDGGDANADTLEAYYAGSPGWTGNSETDYGELLSHKDSITLFDALGVDMAPELKAPQVAMPFEGDFSQTMYASQMLNDYKQAGIDAARVFPQSFSLEDMRQWIQTESEFGSQVVYLDGRYRNSSFDINNADSWVPSMDSMAEDGIRYLASPIWMLLSLDGEGQIVPSDYARAAKTAGLNLIGWTLERSGPITSGNNWYYQSIQPAITNEGDVLKVIDVLIQQVGVTGLFSDWPATTTYYSHCAK